MNDLIRCGECDTAMLEDEPDPLSDWFNYKCPECGNCLSMPPWAFDDPSHYEDYEPEPPVYASQEEWDADHWDYDPLPDSDDHGPTTEDMGY